MNLLQIVEEKHKSPEAGKVPDFRPGDVLAVHVKIREGEKTRIQIFEGTCIATRRRKTSQGSFTVRKISAGGVGVERVFPIHCPNIAKVDLVTKSKSRRAKHYYLRQRVGKSARLAIDYSR